MKEEKEYTQQDASHDDKMASIYTAMVIVWSPIILGFIAFLWYHLAAY